MLDVSAWIRIPQQLLYFDFFWFADHASSRTYFAKYFCSGSSR